MNKLPVGQTIRFAYAFTFGEIGTVIGLIWIPTLINAVIGFFVAGAYYRVMADSFDSGLPPAGAGVTLQFILTFFSMLLLAMIGVAITRQAMGLRQGPAFAHVSLGSAEFRTFGGYFGLSVLIFVFVFLFALVLVGVTIVATTVAKVSAEAPMLKGGVALGALVGGLLLVYMIIRLSFLLVPAVVDGGEFGLTRSWQLTHGNFWRIVAVGCATLLPIFLIFGAAEYAILGPEFFKQQMLLTKDATANIHQMAGQMRAMQTHMPVLMGLSFVISPILYGLAFAPAAFAYRALTGKSTPHGDA